MTVAYRDGEGVEFGVLGRIKQYIFFLIIELSICFFRNKESNDPRLVL